MSRKGCLLLLCFMALCAGPAIAQTADDKKPETGWFNVTELSLVVTEGNSGTDTMGLKNVLTRKQESSEFLFKFDSVRSNTDDDRFLLAEPGFTFLPGETPTVEATEVIQPPKELDVEKFFTEGRYTKHYKKTRTWNTGASWDRNEDAGIVNRFMPLGLRPALFHPPSMTILSGGLTPPRESSGISREANGTLTPSARDSPVGATTGVGKDGPEPRNIHTPALSTTAAITAALTNAVLFMGPSSTRMRECH